MLLNERRVSVLHLQLCHIPSSLVGVNDCVKSVLTENILGDTLVSSSGIPRRVRAGPKQSRSTSTSSSTRSSPAPCVQFSSTPAAFHPRLGTPHLIPWLRCIVHRSCTKRQCQPCFHAPARVSGLGVLPRVLICPLRRHCRRFGLTYVEMARPLHDEHHQLEATVVSSRWQAIECTSVPTSLGVLSWCAL